MCYIGLIKRFVPFVLTFAAGLFIASFFVSIALPNMDGLRQSRRERHSRYHREMNAEIERLNETIRNLQDQNERLRNEQMDSVMSDAVPPVEWNAPKPPPPPRRPKHPRFEIAQ